MKISTISFIVLNIIGLTSFSASAEETQVTNSNQYQPTVELLVGKSQLATNWMAQNETSFGVRGSLDFNQYLAAELAYQDFGKATKYEDLSLGVKGISVGFKGSYLLGNHISLVGRSGLAYLMTSYNNTDGSRDIEDAENNSTDLYYGLGLNYSINQYSFGIEYTHYDISNFVAKDDSTTYGITPNLDNMRLSLGVRF